jgi:hypothetical protein
MHNITELSKLVPQLKNSTLFSILVQVTYGFHQKNVGHLHVSYTKLMIQVNHHHTNKTDQLLTLPTDQEVLQDLPQMKLLLLTD